MPENCRLDADGCIVCPAIQHIDAIPPHLDATANVGWNSGANSVAMLFDANVRTVFQIPAGVASAMCGFRYDRPDPITPSRIAYGFYFTQAAGFDFYSILEYGVVKRAANSRAAAYTFEIRRQGSTIQYLVDDGITNTMVYQSGTPSYGGLIVTGCLFNSGDAIL